MKRAAIWRAVSSREQATDEKASLDAQLKSTTEAAKKLNAVVVSDLCIPGKSRNIHSLEEAARQIDVYQELIDLCEDKKITHLIVDKVDRLGRHRILTMQVYDLCDRCGIYVYDAFTQTLTSPGDDPLPIMIQAYGAYRDVRRMSYNMLRGRRKRVSMGKFSGTLNYGYYYVRDENDERIPKLDKEKAKRVLRAVQLYLEDSGNGINTIAQKLTAEFGEEWNPPSIYNMFRRIRVYAGQVVFNDSWYEGNHEPVISMETALAVERERAERANNKNYGRSSQLFSRMVFCKKCDALMVVRKYFLADRSKRVTYRCTSCGKNVAETKIKVALREWLDNKAEGTAVAAKKRMDPQMVRREQLENRLSEIKSALLRLDERYIAGRLTEDRYDRLLAPLEAEQSRVEAELATEQLPPIEAPEITPDFAELLNVALDEAPHSEANAQLRKLTRVTYHPDTKKIEFA